ncbi:MAG: hypothetical protein O9264_02515 [Leptospira sp.]|nr:hypothetical protein [Leptospira sp.]
MNLVIKITVLFLISFFSTCSLAERNNTCDPLTKSFRETYALKLVIGGISNFCGVSVGSDILGNAQWARTFSAASNLSRILSISTDSMGNIFGAGVIFGNSPFTLSSSVQLTGPSSLSTNAYIVKYTRNGEVLWAKTLVSGTNGTIFNGIVLDNSGNIYAVGTTENNGIYSFGNGVFVNGPSTENILLVKFNQEGTAQWAKSLQAGPNISNFSSIAIDPSGNIIASGYLSGTGTYIFENGISTTVTYSGLNALLVKYDPSGNVQWVKTAQSGNDESVFNSVQTDSSGNIYVVGRISGTNSFEFGNSVSAAGKFSNQNSMIVKYNASGEAQWARSVVETADRSTFSSVAVDYFGNAYAGGLIKGIGKVSFGNAVSTMGTSDLNNIAIVKYDLNGNPLWARSTSSGSDASIINQIFLDARLNVYAIGSITGTNPYSFGEGIQVSAPSTDSNALLIRYNSTGNPQWVRSIFSGGNASRYLTAAINMDGNLYTAGAIFGNEMRSFGNGVEVQGSFPSGTNSILVQYK